MLGYLAAIGLMLAVIAPLFIWAWLSDDGIPKTPYTQSKRGVEEDSAGSDSGDFGA